ncbi:MAG: sugar ABC transporter substrate-binding protein [Chloroflexi bacterium]|nr:sugar ABC transporter substrate-binding protein [Chloroflexota bacterium]
MDRSRARPNDPEIDPLRASGRGLTRRNLLLAISTAIPMGVVACGGSPAGGTAPSAPTKAPAPAAPAPTVAPTVAPAPAPASAPVEITFQLPAAAGLEQDLYSGFLKDFHARQSAIKVAHTFEPDWGSYPVKLKAMLAAGTYPDLVHQHLSVVQDFSQQGVLSELKPYLSRDRILETDFIPQLIEEFTWRGKLMAVPKDSAAFGVYYNRQMIEQSGAKLPTQDWTWDDFTEICTRVTKPENGKFGIVFPKITPDSENWEAILRTFGGGWYDAERTKSTIDTTGTVDALQFMADLEFKHRVTPTAHKFEFTGDAWRGGVVAFALGHHSTTFFHKAEKREFPFDVLPLPKGKGGQFIAVGASGYGVTSQAKYKDQAWELLKFLTSKDVQSRIASGKRWGPSRPDSLDNLAPDDGVPANFKNVHIEPLKGKGNVKPMGFTFPMGQLDILQAYKEEVGDKLWTGQRTARDATAAAKPKIEAILAKFK